MKPITKTLITLTLFLLTSFSLHAANIDSLNLDGADFVLREIRYGRIEAERVARVPNGTSPTGTSGVLRKYEFMSLTDTIPAKLNVSFGAELVLESAEFLMVPLKVVWKFPTDIVNPMNKKYHQVSSISQGVTNNLMFFSYRFDEDYEVKSGIWELEIYHNNKLLYSRQFFLVRDI